ncbi:MAG: hypothetical protein BMS9Abin28_0099 [Anaerolineae bacterium]|nr:MAG: hypothetical protein BMS9Abin28_0099 [Anaerolineae bacterium]
MSRRETVYRIAFPLISILLISALPVGCAGQATEEKVAEPTEEVRPTPTEKDPIAILAAGILSGEIDVGEEFSMSPGGRYHKIHATVLEIECTTCHKTDIPSEEAVFFDQNRSPSAPGPVDRGFCLECHQSGPSSELY